MRETTLFSVLPDYICTPDGMAVDRHGNLVLSCPNFASDDMSGVVVRLDREGNVTKWFDVPVHPETGVARNMGIAFDHEWNVYLCDNQGWSERPELLYKGRVLKLTVTDGGEILRTVVVAEGMEHPNGIRIRDGTVYRLTFGPDGSLKDNAVYARDASQLQSTDGMIFDDEGNLYIADFSANAIARVTPEGKVERIAQSPDCTGVDGGLDQPGEPIVWDGRIIASCFDLVTGPDKVNTKHEMPATLVQLAL